MCRTHFTWVGDSEVAPGAVFYLPCVRNTHFQPLDLAAGEGVCGGEAGAAVRGPN